MAPAAPFWSSVLLTMATAKDVLDAEGVAVITGGASGFGLEAATQCAALGMGVAILDVSERSLPPLDALESRRP